MLAKREIPSSQSSNKFCKIVDPLSTTNEYLDATRVTDEVGLLVLVDSSIELFAAKKQGTLGIFSAL